MQDATEDNPAEQFWALALPHLDGVYTLARYLLGNAADADDATQETFIRAARYFETFHGTEMRPWLFAILRNVARDARRPSREVPDDETDDSVVPLWGEAGDTPERSVLREHDAETVRKLLDALPETFREVIVLREINEMPYREIAEVVGVPVGTVMSRLARARAMLREAWNAAEAA